MKKKFALLFVIISFALFSYLTYSLYRSGSGGTASLASATFSVQLAGENQNISIMPGNTTQNYIVTVTNGSEVDVSYKIVITNLPTGSQIKLDNGSYVTETSGEVVFNNVGTILYGGSPVNHTLTFNSSLTGEEVTNQSISIDVEFKQLLN